MRNPKARTAVSKVLVCLACGPFSVIEIQLRYNFIPLGEMPDRDIMAKVPRLRIDRFYFWKFLDGILASPEVSRSTMTLTIHLKDEPMRADFSYISRHLDRDASIFKDLPSSVPKT